MRRTHIQGFNVGIQRRWYVSAKPASVFAHRRLENCKITLNASIRDGKAAPQDLNGTREVFDENGTIARMPTAWNRI